MTLAAFRIVQSHLAGTAFDGEGARRFGGRWNSPGRRVVYLAETRALAALEMLVHLSSSDILRRRYSIVPVRFPSSLVARVEDLFRLPRDWRAHPAADATRRIGDEWCRRGTSCVLSLPSVVVPTERNYLVNPAHEGFHKIKPGKVERFRFDQRLA